MPVFPSEWDGAMGCAPALKKIKLKNADFIRRARTALEVLAKVLRETNVGRGRSLDSVGKCPSRRKTLRKNPDRSHSIFRDGK